jgi:hypothetical protein
VEQFLTFSKSFETHFWVEPYLSNTAVVPVPHMQFVPSLVTGVYSPLTNFANKKPFLHVLHVGGAEPAKE